MNKWKNILFLPLCFLLLMACGVKKADISAYGEVPITIAGLEETEFTITANELSQLDCVSRTATGATAKAGTANAVGPLLDTFLAQYNGTSSDFYKIRFICSDGYKVVLKDKYLTDYEIILSISSGSDPLPENQQPLRILIPKGESGKWAYGITRIEFEREAPASPNS